MQPIHGPADPDRMGPGALWWREDRGSILRTAVSPAGFEPAAYGLGNRRSIQLSYGDENT